MAKRQIAVFAVALIFTGALGFADRGARSKDREDKHSNKSGFEGWNRRDGYEYRTYPVQGERPPGWNQGKKTGWRNCGLPPGQAKKSGCRTYTHQGQSYYYYHDDVGRIIVRRPTIEIHGSVDIIK